MALGVVIYRSVGEYPIIIMLLCGVGDTCALCLLNKQHRFTEQLRDFEKLTKNIGDTRVPCLLKEQCLYGSIYYGVYRSRSI